MNPDLSLYPNREAIAAQTWQARSRSCVHRLLAGAGQAGLVAYREDPMLTLAALAHGLTSEGEIVVATAEGSNGSAPPRPPSSWCPAACRSGSPR